MRKLLLLGISVMAVLAASREIPDNCKPFAIDKTSDFYDCGSYQIYLEYLDEQDYKVKRFVYLKDGQAIPLRDGQQPVSQ